MHDRLGTGLRKQCVCIAVILTVNLFFIYFLVICSLNHCW